MSDEYIEISYNKLFTEALVCILKGIEIISRPTDMQTRLEYIKYADSTIALLEDAEAV